MANNQSSNPDEAQQTAENALFGSTESFFDALDNDVNGMIKEDSPVENNGATPEMDPQQSTDESGSEDPSNDNWKQRYSDSTREAQRMQGIEMSEAQRMQQADVAGKQFVFGQKENREMQQMNRVSSQISGAQQQQVASQQASSQFLSAGIGAVGNIASSFGG